MDHIIEGLVRGGPTDAWFSLRRWIFALFFTLTRQVVQPHSGPCEDAAAAGRAAAATIVRLPTHVVPYKRLPATGTFTVDTIPAGLLGRHNTKVGVWGQINCVRGRLRLTTLDGQIETVTLAPGPTRDGVDPGIAVVAPQQYHQVTPLSGDTEMFIRFHAKAANDDLSLGGATGGAPPVRKRAGAGLG